MKRWLQERIEGVERIVRIRAEASTRVFFRLYFSERTRVAMVYPGPEPEALERIKRLTGLYLNHGIAVPRIHAVLEDRALVQEDLGNLRLQQVFSRGSVRSRRDWLVRTADILEKLASIPAEATSNRLDRDRLHWEMDFFIQHFASRRLDAKACRRLQSCLIALVEGIDGVPVFAHRDFHSRNMMVRDELVYLVDFQDSLRAPRAYDAVSLAWDAYLDLGKQRERFLDDLDARGLLPSREQVYLTALQRNLKALGTFGFQADTRGKRGYERYIPRTLRHVAQNPLAREVLEDSLDQLITDPAEKWERR